MAEAAASPDLLTETLLAPWGKQILFRPLLPDDVRILADFLSNLSPETRKFWTLNSYDRAMAQGMCDAINRYDKFRMLAVTTQESECSVLALFEFAFHLQPERERFRSYGIELRNEVCKFGPCVRDQFQNLRLGSALMPSTFAIARKFGKQTIVLWGGVMSNNTRAIRFYQKHGFQIAGAFESSPGVECKDMIAYP